MTRRAAHGRITEWRSTERSPNEQRTAAREGGHAEFAATRKRYLAHELVRHDRDALPAQAISEEVLLEKYAKGDERSVGRRAPPRRARAGAGRAAEPRAPGKRASCMRWQTASCPPGASFGGRHALAATLINCFVQPVGDSIASDDDGHPASTPPSPKRPRRCAAAAAWATTSRASDRAARG
jgi:hypothetical protein